MPQEFTALSAPRIPQKVTVREVGLRDGLQSVQAILPTELKCRWIDDAYQAGLREIEIGSMVPPRLLPQLADTRDVLAYAKRYVDLGTSVLVPNLKGAELAFMGEPDVITIPISASTAHSLANVRKSPEEMVSEVARICALRDSAGSKTRVNVGIGTAWGCTLQGEVPQSAVRELARALMDTGCDMLSLGDTVGYADPNAVARLFEQVARIAGPRLRGAHFHDTRGLALANVYAAMTVGIVEFDGALGGIGGCPHAPGASGNVATEDLIYLLDSMRVHTGISLKQLLIMREQLQSWLPHERLSGVIWHAGPPRHWDEQKSSATGVQEPTT